MRVVLAVDPGKTSGICVFTHEHGSEPALVSSGEFLMEDYGTPISNTIRYANEIGARIEVVCERFTINAQTVKNSQAPFSLEQIGILKYIMRENGLDHESIFFQSPSDAKKMFPNPALKKLGYWHVGGGGHALDAMRHGLLRMTKSGWTPVRLLQ